MKTMLILNTLSFLVFSLAFGKGPGSGGGGKPMLLTEVAIPELKDLAAEVGFSIVTTSLACTLVDFPSNPTMAPKKYWYLKIGEKIILDQRVLKFSHWQRSKIFDSIRDYPDRSKAEDLVSKEIEKSDA